MTAFVGRSGADAIYKFLHSVCKTLVRYGPKLSVAIDLTHTAGLIDDTQAALAHNFVSTADGLCDIFLTIANNSGF